METTWLYSFKDKPMSHIIFRLARDLDKLSLVKDVLIKSVHNDEQVIRKSVVPQWCKQCVT